MTNDKKTEKVGLIPARAGNTLLLKATSFSCRAHPRSRGEHNIYRDTEFLQLGSSPLARGTPSPWVLRYCRVGLIPARAGNTPYPVQRSAMQRAHPRSRGEHVLVVGLYRSFLGSSPLARGTQPACCLFASWDRLIPARAGNTLGPRWRHHPHRAHPRSRGEHG